MSNNKIKAPATADKTITQSGTTPGLTSVCGAVTFVKISYLLNSALGTFAILAVIIDETVIARESVI